MSPNTLGFFEVLPPELRAVIWDELRPRSDAQSGMNILRTCSSLYDEVTTRLYHQEVLTFTISPCYDRRCWIQATSQLGASWDLISLQHAISMGFDKLPFGKLDRIIIQLEAPVDTDPGQLVCLCAKARDLVSILSGAASLPSVIISLRDSSPASWTKDGKAQKTMDERIHNRCSESIESDCKEVLLPFGLLRNAREMTLDLPESLETFMADYTSWLLFVTTSPWPSTNDQNLRSQLILEDQNIRTGADESFHMLDRVLDIISGPTACMLRLRRFSFWYDDDSFKSSRYMDDLERAIRNPGQAGPVSRSVAEIRWRYRLMIAFNPLSTKMLEFRSSDEKFEHKMTDRLLFRRFSVAPPEPFSRSLVFTAAAAYLEKRSDEIERNAESSKNGKAIEETKSSGDRWDAEEWHRYYPEGIPRLTASLRRFEKAMRHEISKSH